MNRSQIEKAIAHGFIDRELPNASHFAPVLIDNQRSYTMSRAISAELRSAESFVFSVAFITPSALNVLKQDLLDFKGKGQIITSNYLGFNSPTAYRELLNFPGLDIRVVAASKGFHAKGYVFRRKDHTTVIVGSSNLTVSALSSNHEWNFRFSADNHGHVVEQIEGAISAQQQIAETVDHSWIERYELTYQPKFPPAWLDRKANHVASDDAIIAPPQSRNLATKESFDSRAPTRQSTIIPNQMQEHALASLSKLRSQGKSTALVISATGTGKTILAGLDVRQFKPERLLFLAHREQILDKAAEEFQAVLGKSKHAFGKLSGSSRDLGSEFTALFATTLSFVRAIRQGLVRPSDFDYVIIDEVHRAGASTYLEIVSYLQPKFMLGMTATPERTDGFNVFELFDYNLAYEIRLQQALEENMLVPFHYFGIADYTTASGQTIDEFSDLRYLASDQRADYLVEKLGVYGQSGVPIRGLIFCSRNTEAQELSELLNQRSLNGQPLRTKALSGSDSVEYREEIVRELEAGNLDYLLTVDIFNEGIDIPSLNQIVMMRQTQSSIVFTQQLGRGLRKHPGKDYLVAIDFIGNYANNYLIPTALFGDSSLNKDQIRRSIIDADSDHIIAGVSSVNFDEISKERIFASLSTVKLDSLTNLKQAFNLLKNRLGVTPMLHDFAKHETIDPVVIGTRFGNYAAFVSRVETSSDELNDLSENAKRILTMLTTELLNGKRPQDLLFLQELITHRRPLPVGAYRNLLSAKELDTSDRALEITLRVFNLEWFTGAERTKYGETPLVTFDGTCYHLSSRWCAAWDGSKAFQHYVLDVLATGLHLAQARYEFADSLIVGERYTRKDACRLLNWETNQQATMYGYKVDRQSNTCPIFVTYHKADDIAESTKYEDQFTDQQTLLWYTRSRRTLESKEVKEIISGNVPTYLFVKKDDVEGTDFIYLGETRPYGAMQTTMEGKHGESLRVVTMKLELPVAIDGATFNYLTGGA